MQLSPRVHFPFVHCQHTRVGRFLSKTAIEQLEAWACARLESFVCCSVLFCLSWQVTWCNRSRGHT